MGLKRREMQHKITVPMITLNIIKKLNKKQPPSSEDEWAPCWSLLTTDFHGKLKVGGSMLHDPECDILACLVMVYSQPINAVGWKGCSTNWWGEGGEWKSVVRVKEVLRTSLTNVRKNYARRKTKSPFHSIMIQAYFTAPEKGQVPNHRLKETNV